MFNRISSKLSIAVLLTAVAFTSAATLFEVKNPSSSKGLVVHEWGTFTSVTNADGQRQTWSPLTGPSDLPSFVYRSKQQTEFARGNCVKCGWAYVRMETPVLYFYSDEELPVSVNVGFPQGSITEWYPQASQSGSGIKWANFIVKPGAQPNFPVEKAESHYYPARETDAAPIQLGAEQEKFLFYRGIGNFDLPTDAILPITITPAPTELARVLVGRLEIITPEMELAIQSAAQKFFEGSVESRAEALKTLHPYGRFAEPTLRRLMENAHKVGQARASQPYWDFMNAALADGTSKR